MCLAQRKYACQLGKSTRHSLSHMLREADKCDHPLTPSCCQAQTLKVNTASQKNTNPKPKPTKRYNQGKQPAATDLNGRPPDPVLQGMQPSARDLNGRPSDTTLQLQCKQLKNH